MKYLMIITTNRLIKTEDIQRAFGSEFSTSFIKRANSEKIISEISLVISDKQTVARYGIPRNGDGDTIYLTNGFTKNWVINTLFATAHPRDIAILTNRLPDRIAKEFGLHGKRNRIILSYSPQDKEMHIVINNSEPELVSPETSDKIIEEFSLAV